jgi:hypothetical protein
MRNNLNPHPELVEGVRSGAHQAREQILRTCKSDASLASLGEGQAFLGLLALAKKS